MPIYIEKVKDKKTGERIEKIVDGKKQYFIKTYVKDEMGRSKQITRHNPKWIGRDGYWEAQQEENRLKNNYIEPINKQEQFKINNITITVAFNEMLVDDELYNKNSESSRITYKQRFNKHIDPKLGSEKIIALTTQKISSFVQQLKNDNLDITYINVILELLKRVYYYITDKYNLDNKVQFHILRKNKDEILPVTIEDLIKANTTLSPQDWQKFSDAIEQQINATKGDTKITLMKLALLYSCEYILLTRVGETQGMKFKNLIVDSNIYVLYEAWNKSLKKMTPLKNRKARLLYIPPKLTEMFVNLYNLLHNEYGITEDDFLFGAIDSNIKDTPISRRSIDRYRHEICDIAKITHVTNHEFRHAGISNAIHNEVDASAVSDMAGHNKQIMFSTYVQTLKSANLELVNTLNKIKIPNLKQDQKQDQRKIA